MNLHVLLVSGLWILQFPPTVQKYASLGRSDLMDGRTEVTLPALSVWLLYSPSLLFLLRRLRPLR